VFYIHNILLLSLLCKIISDNFIITIKFDFNDIQNYCHADKSTDDLIIVT